MRTYQVVVDTRGMVEVEADRYVESGSFIHFYVGNVEAMRDQEKERCVASFQTRSLVSVREAPTKTDPVLPSPTEIVIPSKARRK